MTTTDDRRASVVGRRSSVVGRQSSVLSPLERRLRRRGLRRVAGVDEAGRGPLAGPVMAAAVVLPDALRRTTANAFLLDVCDSKRLGPVQREELYEAITAACAWGVGLAEVAEIDEMGIAPASLLAMRRAVGGLPVEPEFVLTDAFAIPDLRFSQAAIVHGDALCRCIAAASIVAKVTRDRLMAELEARYPGYGLAQHKGYPTPQHREALKQLGPSPIHRRSFAPVRALLGGREEEELEDTSSMQPPA